MTIWSVVGGQLRHPRGPVGWLAGQLMRVANRRPNVLAIEALQLRSTDNVLELGCGPGHALGLMARRACCGTVHAIDQSATMLAQARRRNRKAVRAGRVRLYQARFEQLPFASCSIDKILAVNVAYFWRDAEAVVREAWRVLRPDGMLSIYVTNAATMRRWRFADPETHRLFDRLQITDALRAGGFRDEMIAVRTVRITRRIAGLIATIGIRSASGPELR